MPSIDRLYPTPPRGNDKPLMSNWDGLSPHLLAHFYPVVRKVEGTTVLWQRDPDGAEVIAPITDGQVEQRANWLSPFENQTPDARLSSLSAMFQSAGFIPLLNAFQQYLQAQGIQSPLLDSAKNQLTTLEGRTAVTKLNSTQIFSGMPPLTITVTAHFRALYDSSAEVEDPMHQLMAWAAPKKLAQQGIVGNTIDSNTRGAVRTIYPSEAPQIIAMQYANMLLKPLVIEAIPYELTGPRDSDGRLIRAAVTMTLQTLMAMDKDDWAAFRRF
jgi:hypothetical protein